YTVLDFMIERFRACFVDEDIPAAVFIAVSAKKLSQLLDINQRAQAAYRFCHLAEASVPAAAKKRVPNTLERQGGDTDLPALQMSLLTEAAEKQRAAQAATLQSSAQALIAARKYREGLEKLASLRAAVDAFFDNVMVMADD